jgi:hypothetical protein
MVFTLCQFSTIFCYTTKNFRTWNSAKKGRTKWNERWRFDSRWAPRSEAEFLFSNFPQQANKQRKRKCRNAFSCFLFSGLKINLILRVDAEIGLTKMKTNLATVENHVNLFYISDANHKHKDFYVPRRRLHSGIVSACQRGDWSYIGSRDWIPPGL